MADGALAGLIAGQNTNTNDSQRDDNASFVDVVALIERVNLIADGTYTKVNTPILGRARDGMSVASYVDDFYYRFHAIPREVDLGSVADTVVQPFYIWNAFFHDASFDAVAETGVSGLTIGGSPIDYVANALELIPFTVTAPRVGPPAIDSIFTFDLTPAFDSVQRAVTVTFSGFRSVLPPWTVDWSDPFAIEYEYRTEVLVSRNGAEQRRALRSQPRRKVRHTIAIWQGKLRKVRGMIQNARLKSFAIPESPRKVKTTAAVAIGVQDLPVAEVPAWVEVNRTVVLSSGQQQAIYTVAAVDVGIITLAQENTFLWPVGTKVHPAIIGLLSDPSSLKLVTNTAGVGDIELMETPGTKADVAPADADVQHNGIDVFLRKPNWGQDVEIEQEHLREQVDFGVGWWKTFAPQDFARETRKMEFLSKNDAETREVIDLFDRMKGRRGAFYMPTWEDDIIPARQFGGGSPVLYVDGTDLVDEYEGTTTAKAIYVRLKNGTVSYHNVLGIREVEESGTTYSVLDFDASIAPVINVEDVDIICWLYLWRFAADRLLVEWQTDEVSICNPTFMLLEDR